MTNTTLWETVNELRLENAKLHLLVETLTRIVSMASPQTEHYDEYLALHRIAVQQAEGLRNMGDIVTGGVIGDLRAN